MAAPTTTPITLLITTMFDNTLRGEGTIVLNNRKQSIKLNMNAFRILTQKFNVTLTELEAFMGENELDAICAIAFCGIKAAAASKGKTYDEDYDIFCAQFLEDDKGIKVVTDLFSASTTDKEEDSGNE